MRPLSGAHSEGNDAFPDAKLLIISLPPKTSDGYFFAIELPHLTEKRSHRERFLNAKAYGFMAKYKFGEYGMILIFPNPRLTFLLLLTSILILSFLILFRTSSSVKSQTTAESAYPYISFVETVGSNRHLVPTIFLILSASAGEIAAEISRLLSDIRFAMGI